MKNFFKKVLDFLLSLIQPKKMIRYRNINLFLIVLIFLGCMLLCSGISNLSLVRYVKRNIENYKLFPEVYDLEYEGGVNFPSFSIDEPTGGITGFKDGNGEEEDIYEIKFALQDGSTLNLTVVYEPDVYVNDRVETVHDDRLSSFDLNGYYNYVPKRDENGNLLEKDMLVIIHHELVYYIFNHGFESAKNEIGSYTRYLEFTGWSIREGSYMLPNDASEIAYTDESQKELDVYKWTKPAKLGDTIEIDGEKYTAKYVNTYYLPASEEELVLNSYGEYDVRKWTKIAKDKDECVYLNEGEKIIAESRLKSNIHEIFVSDNQTRVGVFSLYHADLADIKFGDLGNGKYPVNPTLMVQAIADLMVPSAANQLQTLNFLYAVIFIIFMPILWTFATWVMGKKFGELTRFKEYYAICAISFIIPSILIAIFTIFFEPYVFIAQYAMFVQVAFYIFCIFKMNNPKRKPTNKDDGDDNKNNSHVSKEEVDLKVETELIQERISKTAKME